MSPALHLEVAEKGIASLVFDVPGCKVNVFTRQVLAELEQHLTELAERREISVLVLLSAKPGSFSAGMDIDEIAAVTDPGVAEEASRLGHRLFSDWSRLPFPTLAAVGGTCVGGGTELALACDVIAMRDRDDLRIGLPEVRLGIIPAWGGCSRLPLRIGVALALDMILAGKTVSPGRARRLGLVDALLPDAGFEHHVRELALRLAAGRQPGRRSRTLRLRLAEGNRLGRSIVFNQARKRVLEKTGGHYPAPLKAIEVVELAVNRGLDVGFDAEARATGELAVSPVAKNLLHVFRLMESVKNRPLPAASRPIGTTAVFGAGTMGGGIAQLLSEKLSCSVRLKDLAIEPLAGGMGHAAGLFRRQVDRHRLLEVEARTKMNLLRPSLDDSGLEQVDLVLEAVVEDLGVKQRLFAEIASRVRDETLLLSNTSSLSIDSIAERTPRPERIAGMHFFHPVHRMPLVEVIRGTRTSEETLSTVIDLTRRLGKTPVVVADAPGFLVNRLLGFYMVESLWLLAEGHDIESIDRAMTDWGMPIGPLTLIDEVGVDVAVKVAHILADAFEDRLPLPEWTDALANEGRLGKKSGHGIYRYADGSPARPDETVYGALGLPLPRSGGDRSQLAERLVLPMVNEAARCLEGQIVGSAGDLDLAMILGTGFPPFRGGLCRWADSQGLGPTIETLTDFALRIGPRFRPSAALERTSTAGGFYRRFTPNLTGTDLATTKPE